MQEIWNVLSLGGPTAIPLMIASIFSLAVIIEKTIFFAKNKQDNKNLIRKVEMMIDEGDTMSAYNQLKGKKGPNVKLLSTALSNLDEDSERIREALQVTGQNEIRKMEKHLTILDVIAMIAPLLGLLGTVLGIISSFNILGGAAGIGDPTQISAGIASALISTAIGLIIAIPTAIFYSYFSKIVDRRAHQLNQSIVEIMDVVDGNDRGEKYEENVKNIS
ncbi:MotA/TolQ/ExbB proton channel family protein [Halarsenatibacter silvermanii]|uniref:Biopolymer transport protein ExbB n=1 Tax=Halarsenatibacter silvermanii TaxID=321763 RepID=A0A1G9NZQ1_9FIRM|nr:MotA/TolQ/ExbB proton channel family protein [Halarsenatibacter silvermanii]SDL92066.1 biopolymer transport protein ExbB [Halarsenatibacter silvermanii]